MADGYDNGYKSADFKRNSVAEENRDQDMEDGSVKLNEKAGEYVRELLSEKIKLNNAKFPISVKLIDQEVTKVQATGKLNRDQKYVDVYKEKPVKVVAKVLVPIKEFPKFNFVGKLLGPKGNTMKQLQDETMCKMAVLGRGSMRDKQKEEELRNSLDPKYAHLSDELHVEISALAPPAEAYARIAYALAEVKKYLIPDPSDMAPQHMMERDFAEPRPALLPPPVVYKACTLTNRSYSFGNPVIQAPMHPPPRPGMPPRGPPPAMRGAMPARSKVISILDRARNAMESSYGYEDSYADPPMSRGPPPRAPEVDYYYDQRGQDRFYEDDSYDKYEQQRPSARDVGSRRAPAPTGAKGQYRAQPYGGRPNKPMMGGGGGPKRRQ